MLDRTSRKRYGRNVRGNCIACGTPLLGAHCWRCGVAAEDAATTGIGSLNVRMVPIAGSVVIGVILFVAPVLGAIAAVAGFALLIWRERFTVVSD